MGDKFDGHKVVQAMTNDAYANDSALLLLGKKCGDELRKQSPKLEEIDEWVAKQTEKLGGNEIDVPTL